MTENEVRLLEDALKMSFGELLMHWDDHYQSNHRYGDIGYKSTEKIVNKHYRITLHGGLYPDNVCWKFGLQGIIAPLRGN